MATNSKPITCTFFLIFFIVSVLGADSTISETTTPINPKCRHIYCDQAPKCTGTELSPLDRCATDTILNTRYCGHPYKDIGEIFYTGYTKVEDEYCNKSQPAQLKQDIDFLVTTSCWNQTLFCIAKPLGIYTGTKLPEMICRQSWDKLEDCWKIKLPWECSLSVKRISHYLYDTIHDCGGSPSVISATTSTFSFTPCFILVALAVLLSKEWPRLLLDQCLNWLHHGTCFCCVSLWKKTLIFAMKKIFCLWDNISNLFLYTIGKVQIGISW